MFFWVFPRRQYVICRRFGTMCQFHLQRLEVVYFQPLKMELIHGSETSAYYILTPGKYPKEHIQYTYVKLIFIYTHNFVACKYGPILNRKEIYCFYVTLRFVFVLTKDSWYIEIHNSMICFSISFHTHPRIKRVIFP